MGMNVRDVSALLNRSSGLDYVRSHRKIESRRASGSERTHGRTLFLNSDGLGDETIRDNTVTVGASSCTIP